MIIIKELERVRENERKLVIEKERMSNELSKKETIINSGTK